VAEWRDANGMFPQRQRCGLIEAPSTASSVSMIAWFPQRQRCGLIEAKSMYCLIASARRVSAAATLRPH